MHTSRRTKQFLCEQYKNLGGHGLITARPERAHPVVVRAPQQPLQLPLVQPSRQLLADGQRLGRHLSRTALRYRGGRGGRQMATVLEEQSRCAEQQADAQSNSTGSRAVKLGSLLDFAVLQHPTPAPES